LKVFCIHPGSAYHFDVAALLERPLSGARLHPP